MIGQGWHVQAVLLRVEEATLHVVAGFRDDGAVFAERRCLDDALECGELPVHGRQRQDVFHHVHRRRAVGEALYGDFVEVGGARQTVSENAVGGFGNDVTAALFLVNADRLARPNEDGRRIVECPQCREAIARYVA